MAVLKCKMCAGDIIPVEGKNLGVCDSCGSTVTIPSITDERRADAFNRGNHFRQVYEFDDALQEYSQIVKEDPTDAEAHWCMTLCRYGINYQWDHRTGQRIPTCDRVSYTSILEDPDYKAALKYADDDQKALYQAEAQKIYTIQQGILEVSAKEKPFDVFICFKDTDDKTGKRTPDSVLAQDLYSELTKRDYKVFFSRITLKEEHMGEEWEPYIFAALNSAKVMLVVGTTPDNFNSPWVKNEWSRFLHLRRTDKTKILIPCVSGMNPNALPSGLRELEGRDMNEISFMQDILYGIERVVRGGRKTSQNASGSTVTADNFVKRAFMELEDGNFNKAEQLLERALNLEPENGQAHLGNLLIERECTCVEELAKQHTPLSGSGNYNRALKYCDLGTQQQLRAAESQIQEYLRLQKQEEIYQDLRSQLYALSSSEDAECLAEKFDGMADYKDCAAKAEEAREKRDALQIQEAEEQHRREQKAKRDAEEKAQKEAADRAAQAQAALRARKRRRTKRIRRFIFFLILLGVLGYFGNKKYLQEPRILYNEAQTAMDQGDYQTATEKFFSVAGGKFSTIFFGDAEDKAIEACTAWLGREPVIMDTDECPWFSLDDAGLLEFDIGEYVSEDDFTLPTILDGKLVTGFSDRCFDDVNLVSLYVPENYTYIGAGAFTDCVNLTVLELSSYTDYIGPSAFCNCDSLTSIVIPGTTKVIGNSAFEDCDYLNSVTLSPGIQEIGEKAFYECTGLSSISIPGSVTTIGNYAFSESGIAVLTIEDGVSAIGEEAFAYCKNLTEVTIPGSCTEVGVKAFVWCDALGTVNLGSGVQVLGEKAFSDCGQLWNLNLSDTLVTIGNRAFANDKALGSLEFPGTLTSVGEEAFVDCDGIYEVFFADNSGLTIGYQAFYDCDTLNGAYIGTGTTVLGEGAFDYCEEMTWVTLPEGLTSIGAWCFSNDALQEVTIPSTVTTIGEGAFNNCFNLQGVAVPEGVTIIESDTFASCDSLYWVWLPEGLSIVRDDAFYGSNGLSQVYFTGSAESWNYVSKGNNDALNTAMLIPDYHG